MENKHTHTLFYPSREIEINLNLSDKNKILVIYSKQGGGWALERMKYSALYMSLNRCEAFEIVLQIKKQQHCKQFVCGCECVRKCYVEHVYLWP